MTRVTGRWVGERVALIALSFALWAGCLWAYSRHNDFPAAYHPDEASKSGQLVYGGRNYNHPQLMLEAALWVLPSPVPNDLERVTIRARVVSAAFGAGAAVMMAWAGYAAAGWVGFVMLGLAVGLCPALLAHAHFLKEDATLVFGVACVLCAGAWLIRLRGQGPQLWAIIGLGVACGVAAAGKYCGVVMLVPALPLAVFAPLARRNWGLAVAGPLVVLAFAVVTWAAIDWRVFDDFNGFLDGFGREQEHGLTGHHGLTLDKPTGFFANLVWAEAMPHVKTLLLLTVPVLLVLTWRGRRNFASVGFSLWLLLTTTVYLVMLSYSTIPFYRYALPVTTMLYALAAMTLVQGTTLLPRYRVAALFVGGVLVAGLQGWRCVDYTRQFADDSRDALRTWAWTVAEAGTPVAADSYAAVDVPGRGDFGPVMRRLNVLRVLSPADPFGGTVDGLRRAGVRYVISAGSASDRYFSPYVHAEPGDDRESRTIAFYHDLATYPVVWSRVAKHPMWTFADPDIRVYDIAPR